MSACRWAVDSSPCNVPAVSGLNPCRWTSSLLHTLERTAVRCFTLHSEISSHSSMFLINHGSWEGQEDTNIALHYYKESSHQLKRLQKFILTQCTCNLFSMTPLRLLKYMCFRYFITTTVFYYPLMTPGLTSKNLCGLQKGGRPLSHTATPTLFLLPFPQSLAKALFILDCMQEQSQATVCENRDISCHKGMYFYIKAKSPSLSVTHLAPCTPKILLWKLLLLPPQNKRMTVPPSAPKALTAENSWQQSIGRGEKKKKKMEKFLSLPSASIPTERLPDIPEENRIKMKPRWCWKAHKAPMSWLYSTSQHFVSSYTTAGWNKPMAESFFDSSVSFSCKAS